MEAQPPAASDGDLIRRVVEGDEEAFGALYDRYAEVVFGAAIRFLGDRQLAEDVVQETYLAMWNRAELFDPQAGSLPGWLSTIARNRAVDRLRAAGRRPAMITMSAAAQPGETEVEALERLAAGSAAAGTSGEGDPETALLRAWTGALVRSTVDAMPEPERIVIELAYFGGLTQSEIAGRLGWPLGTVKTRTRRALERLRATLGGSLEGPAQAELRGRTSPPAYGATGTPALDAAR